MQSFLTHKKNYANLLEDISYLLNKKKFILCVLNNTFFKVFTRIAHAILNNFNFYVLYSICY